MQLQPNITFDNHYTLIRQLGRGGFSEVWLAHDSYMDLDVALKIYAPGQGMDEHSIDELRREIKVVFTLNHPNLLTPKYLGVWDGMPYLVLAYCSRGSLTQQIGKLPEQELWHVLHDVAAGLAYLHKNDIVHQDIKPDNILIDDSGNYVITDFGISAKARSTLRKSVIGGAESGGTTAYMGPERFSRQPAPTKASDIWSFGAMVYEVLEGNVPFGEVGGGLQKGGAEIPIIQTNVSDKLKSVITKMLQQETWDRPTAEELVTDKKNNSISSPSQSTQGFVRTSSSITDKKLGNIHNSGASSKVGFLWFFLIVSIIAVIILSVLYYNADKESSNFRREAFYYYTLYKRASQELTDLKYNIMNYPLVISKIEVGNVYEKGKIETNYGDIIYSSRSMFLQPKINYVGINSGKHELKIKLYEPNGTMNKGSSSPNDCTYSCSVNVYSGKNEVVLPGWGVPTMGHWSKGSYKYEIWYNNTILAAKTFTIY